MSREALQMACDALFFLRGYMSNRSSDHEVFLERCEPALRRLVTELSKPEQEPIAWMCPGEDGDGSVFLGHSTIVRCKGHPWTGWAPLYTSPLNLSDKAVQKRLAAQWGYERPGPHVVNFTVGILEQAEAKGFRDGVNSQQPVSEDTKRLEWYSEHENHVIKIGNAWYVRSGYQQPFRKHKTLRAAIDAAMREKQ